MCEQHPDLVDTGDLHEAAVVLQDQVMFGVVGPKFDTSGARQRTALAADLGASHVGQHRLSVGGGEKLDDVRRCERFDDPLHNPVGMPEPMNNRTGWLPCNTNAGSSTTSRSMAHV